MAKAWRVVIIIVLVAMLFGFVGIGVGVMTGANMERVFSMFTSRYGAFYESIGEVVNAALGMF